jgi:hypothetical protein
MNSSKQANRAKQNLHECSTEEIARQKLEDRRRLAKGWLRHAHGFTSNADKQSADGSGESARLASKA